MEQMSTRRNDARNRRRVQVLRTDRTTAMRCFHHAFVLSFEANRQTQSTIVTMKKVLPTALSANATIDAMKLPLVFIVVESTDDAKVRATEGDAARHTTSTNSLQCSALKTLYEFHLEAIHDDWAAIIDLVVAQATSV